MHSKNLHLAPYDFKVLQNTYEGLSEFVIINNYNQESIDFSNPKAVLILNKALLKYFYKVQNWTIPEGNLCPPIPGRADYLLHIDDLLALDNNKKVIKGLDIGVGANCIYPILATQLFNWKMVGADIDLVSVEFATKNAYQFKEYIEIRHQTSNANIFKGIIKNDEFFDFTICNPPFYSSEKEAINSTMRKLKNLNADTDFKQNFGGKAHELWCNGGEALFIKRMIKESIDFKTNVGWFTCLVSKSDNLEKIYKQLTKVQATYKTINMEQGNKKTRFVAWRFKV